MKHAAVDRFVTPDEFEDYARMARAKGFLLVSATPLTRSSYHADHDFAAAAPPRRAAASWPAPDRMPTHAEKRILRYTPEQLFDLVADVRRYPEFLPWCVGARVDLQHRDEAGRRPHHRLQDVPRDLPQPRSRWSGRDHVHGAVPERALPLPEQPVALHPGRAGHASSSSSSTSSSAPACCRRSSAPSSTRRCG